MSESTMNPGTLKAGMKVWQVLTKPGHFEGLVGL